MTGRNRTRHGRGCYFQPEPGSPEPLSVTTGTRVRFEELDPLRIVWHGRYVSYFEDARVAFGRQYGLSYARFMQERIAAPIVQLHIDYHHPLTFDEQITISAILHWCDALRLNFEFRVNRENGALAATGYSVQLITDLNGNVLFLPPDWISHFRQEWRDGLFYGNKDEKRD